MIGQGYKILRVPNTFVKPVGKKKQKDLGIVQNSFSVSEQR